jgi:homoaconitase/3-isopropylmalate dehydratase large subunit
VLTLGEQHPWAAHELSFGEAAYWAQHDARDDVFFADATAVDRARTRPVVIVAVNAGADADVDRVLPSALKLAAALLVVCGNTEQVKAALAPAARV